MSADMQSFVRQVQPVQAYRLPGCSPKNRIVRLMDMIKLDIVEAKVLTGTEDLEGRPR